MVILFKEKLVRGDVILILLFIFGFIGCVNYYGYIMRLYVYKKLIEKSCK